MKNNYEIRGELTVIIINSPKYGRKEALISTNKLDRAKEFSNTWSVHFKKNTNAFYVKGHTGKTNKKRETMLLHRWITNAPVGMVVDHINHDGLINTDDNLRIVTGAQNGQNRKGAQKNSTTGIRGVWWDRDSNKWVGVVEINNKKTRVGFFDDISEAEQAVKEYRMNHMPYSQDA